MRIDKFLNAVNLTKSRSIATDMLNTKVVYINDIVAKPSKEIKVGDVIKLVFLEDVKKYKILEIPKTKTTPKSQKDRYIAIQ